MTRINVVPVEELCNQHLFAEWRELPRIYTLINNRNGEVSPSEIPLNYVLGSGHVKFFYDKLGFLTKRHGELTAELLKRNYNIGSYEAFTFTIPENKLKFIWNNWKPSDVDLKINRERIKDRMPKSPKWSKVNK
jgi:deoxyribonuclease (pyrimidine dimer)